MSSALAFVLLVRGVCEDTSKMRMCGSADVTIRVILSYGVISAHPSPMYECL